MHHQSHRPKTRLKQFVDFIWIGKATEIQLSSAHHAPLFTELIFNYQGIFQMEGQHIESNAISGVTQVLSGLKTRPFHTTVQGSYGAIGLILKPHCYGTLLDHLGTSLMNDISEQLYFHLYENDSPSFETAEKILLPLFDKAIPLPILQQFEQYLIHSNIEKGILKSFTSTKSHSQKSFIQTFKQHYTLTPNTYIQLKKVNHAVELLKNKPIEKLTQIGLEAGFYDQPHFIRTFKKFCGHPPREFRKTNQG